MITTTYGYRKPEAGDRAKGTGGWFAAYEFNVDRFDAHNHDGANSPLLSISSLAPYTSTLPVSVSTTGSTTNSSTTIASVASTTGCAVGASVTGTGIPVGATIASFTATTIVLSAAATATNAGITLTIASWIDDGTGAGGFKRTVTVPAGITEVNDYHISFIFTAPAGQVGERALLRVDRLTATTYDLYCNDNTAAFTAVYR